MAPTVTPTKLNANGDTVLLKIVADDVEMTLVTRNQTTNALASDYLTTEQLALLEARLALVTANIAAADVASINNLLAALLIVSDVTGTTTPQGSVAAGVESLKLVGMTAASTYYVVISVPHSRGPMFGPAPL